MGTSKVFILLVVAMAIMLILVLKFKINAAIALLAAALVMGIGSGLPLPDMVEGINGGFGSFMSGSGFAIGLGIILGQFVYDYGGATNIAKGIISVFPENKAIYALSLAAFVLSIPVFFDVAFILLVPLGIATAKQLNKPIQFVVVALMAGATVTHSCVPPTPGPIAVAGIFGLDLGKMILFGVAIGLASVVLTLKVMMKIMDRKSYWNPEQDESGEVGDTFVELPISEGRKTPNPLISALPILTPVVLLLTNTFANMLMDEVPLIIQFFGDKTISMLAGVVVAMLIGKMNLSWEELNRSAQNALLSAGLVLMITGSGSAFGKILTLCGVSDAITSLITSVNAGKLTIILLVFGVAAILRIAQGSATVSCVTSASIMAPIVASLGVSPLWCSLAACAGSISVDHINDSAFWVITSKCGLSVRGGLKTVTLTGMIVSGFIMLFTLILAAILPF